MIHTFHIFIQWFAFNYYRKIFFTFLCLHTVYTFCCGCTFSSAYFQKFTVYYFELLIYLDADVENYDVSKLLPDDLQQVEADSYWCMAKLLDGIQDNYTFAQPGIQKKVYMLKELMQRIDGLCILTAMKFLITAINIIKVVTVLF